MEEIPSGCPSPVKIEKTESSSSRVSDSQDHCDFEESCVISKESNRDGRIRQSSWDDSDDDLSPGPGTSPESSRIYSNDSKQLRGSVSSEINELKKQFFEALEKMRDENDNGEPKNLRDKIESKLNSDRRQSPARMRRRTKSSSSSSPVLDSKSHNSPEKTDKLNGPEAIFEEISSKILEFNPKFYLNNFFTELRSRRISLINSIPMTEKVEELSDYDSECVQISSEIGSPDSNENNDYFCKTSRKLSQILEVEENKTDLEKSSEEKIDDCELFSKTLKKTEEKHNSPLQTARSRKSEKNSEIKTAEKEKYKSLSYEEFGNFQKTGKTIQGNLSERSTIIFNRKISDNFISLSAEDGRTKLGSLSDKKPFHFLCPLSSKRSYKNFSKEPNFIDGKEENLGSRECLKIDLMKSFMYENTSPSKSTDRSERTHTSRTKSAKSRQCINPESPKFTINVGKDSERSIKVEDINTPDSSEKDSKIRTYSEAPSLEDCSPTIYKKYNKSSGKSESKFEPKTKRTLESSSLDSAKSSYRSSRKQNTNYLKGQRNYQASHKKKEQHREDNQSVESEMNDLNLTYTVEKTESSSSVESSRSYKNSNNKSNISRSSAKTSNIEILNNYEHQSSCKSSRSSNSDKMRSLKAVKDDQLSDQRTSRSNKILELGLPLEISERPESGKESCRSAKTTELDDVTKDSDPSETNLLKNISRRTSERSLSSRSKTSGSKRSTPRCLKITSRTNSGKSKDSLQNHDDNESTESIRIAAWKELEKICDTTGNYISASSSSSISSWRELEVTDQQNLYGKNDLEESRSIKNSRRSPDSQIIDLLHNNSSDKSMKTKSRPTSWTSEEPKIPKIHSDVEKVNVGVINEKSTGRFFISEEDEEQGKSSSPTQKSESRTESDRNLNKKLSVINEASYDDLKTCSENEEKDHWKHSEEYSEGINNQLTPQRVTKSSKSSSSENSLDESSSEVNNPDDGKWNELIEKFSGSSNSSCVSKSNFPGFSHKNENLFDAVKDPTLEENAENNKYFENLDDFSSPSKRYESKYNGSPQNYISLEKAFKEREEDKKAFNLEFKEPLLIEDLKENHIRPVQRPQNLFYLNLNREGPFEIGEFGDVTCWNTCKSDTIDSEKPKDHGDGTQTQKTAEVFILTEKREKEVKAQRNLWTELKKDFRDSKPFINKLFFEIDGDLSCTRFIPLSLKTSKSDNCIKRKINEGYDCQTPVICKFLSEYTSKKTENKFLEFGRKRKKEVKSVSKSTVERHSSLESLEFEKEEIQELNCEITPRLSRSLSNFEILIQKETLMNGKSNESFNTSGTQLFEKTTGSSKSENDFTDFNVFLARNEKKEKMIKSNNWLTLKNPQKEKLHKQSKKIKRKSSSLQRGPFHEYLFSRKNQSNVPQLKLRNSNCFQNFYKRFISVFCLTSNSSAATPK